MGKALAVMALLVVGIGVAGFANYQRNAHLDREFGDRPYKGISEADLRALRDAYRAELGRFERKLGSYSSDRTKVLDGFAPGDMGGKAKAFDSFQRQNKAWREVNLQRIERELELEKIAAELALRERGLDDPVKRFWRRVLTF